MKRQVDFKALMKKTLSSSCFLFKKYKFFIVTLVIIIFNILLMQVGHSRIDMTQEKKYTLSKKTIEILSQIEDKIYFKIYFTGNLFTPELNSLKKEIKQLLSEFKYYSKFIDYEFINLYSMENEKKRDQKIYQLTQNNVNWTFHPKLKNEYILWGAEITYQTEYSKTISFLNDLDKEWPIECAGKNDKILDCLYEYYTEKCLSQLEYKLINSIKNALNGNKKKKKIGIINGHGEKNADWIYSLKKQLEFEEEYTVNDSIYIDESKEFATFFKEVVKTDSIKFNYNLSDYDCIIINNPTDSFYRPEKFILDQYIMSGGKTLWLIKGTRASIDSLQQQSEFPLLDLNINIADMLYKYGARINPNLARDYKNSEIKLTEPITGLIRTYPWDYFPVIDGSKNHSISKEIYNIKTQFPSSIDTIKNNIKKTILLQTSEYSTTSNIMDIISFDHVRYMLEKNKYTQKHLPIAVLLEGTFTSIYTNILPKEYKEKLNFIEQVKEKNRMIVISDGDLIRNQIGKSTESRNLELDQNGKLFATPPITKPLPLGYDKNTFKKYNNSNFILNCINYLIEGGRENNLFEIRKKQTRINKLDKILLEEKNKKWKIINVIIPQFFILILGLTLYIRRTRKYKA